MQALPMAEQAIRIDAELETWRGKVEQTDDILMIGIRF
jgi:hypothetical protein